MSTLDATTFSRLPTTPKPLSIILTPYPSVNTYRCPSEMRIEKHT